MIKVLVTGASGSIGLQFVNILQHNSFSVRILSRKALPSHLFEKPVESVVGDMTDNDCLKKAICNVEIVFHLAAKLHINNPDEKDLEDYINVNVKGTVALVRAAEKYGVRRFIYISTISVYGNTKSFQVADELSPLKLSTYYARTKYEAEKYVLGAKNLTTNTQIGIVLRAASVYGPNMKGNYVSLIRALRKNLFLPIGKGLNRRTLIYIDDLISACLVAAKHPKAPGRIFNVTDGQPHSFSEIIETVCKCLHKRPPRFFIPFNVAYYLTYILEKFAKLVNKRSPVTTILLDKLTEDLAVSSLKIEKELGFKPKFDLKAGFSKTLNQKQVGL